MIARCSRYCPQIHRDASRRFAVVVIQQPAKPRPTPDRLGRVVVIAVRRGKRDQPASEALMVSLGIGVRDELREQVPKQEAIPDADALSQGGRQHEPRR